MAPVERPPGGGPEGGAPRQADAPPMLADWAAQAVTALNRGVSMLLAIVVPSRRFARALVPMLAAVAAAGGSYWWLARLGGPETELAPDDARRPDYWLTDMRRTTLDERGRVASVLTAARLEHYPHDDSTELEAPRLALYNDPEDPWYAVSERAWASGDGEVVKLLGPVDIYRLDERGRRKVEVLTSDLKVLPREQYAETARPATISGRSTVTTAIGMRANFSQDRLELLNEVKTRHERPDEE